MSTCIFCKIINREIPSTVVYEDDKVIAFKDINPIAPVHILVIPKKHIETLNHVEEEDKELLGHILVVTKKIAEEQGIAESGYRVINNCGNHGGQVVFHLHFHLIGGEPLGAKIR